MVDKLCVTLQASSWSFTHSIPLITRPSLKMSSVLLRRRPHSRPQSPWSFWDRELWSVSEMCAVAVKVHYWNSWQPQLRTFSKDDGNVNVDNRKSINQHSVVLRMLACPQLVVHMSFRTPFRGISRCAVNVSIFCDVFTCFVTFPRTVCGFLIYILIYVLCIFFWGFDA